jgi:hypothetical protein
MKTLIIVRFAFLVAQTLSAQVPEVPVEKKAAAVDNITMAIVSGNTVLHTSGALLLSDLIRESYLESSDASKVMIPLLKFLENGKTDQERIAAAVALYQLGNEVGIYRLRGVAIFDSNEKVAEVCRNLYVTYHKLHRTEYLVSF